MPPSHIASLAEKETKTQELVTLVAQKNNQFICLNDEAKGRKPNTIMPFLAIKPLGENINDVPR